VNTPSRSEALRVANAALEHTIPAAYRMGVRFVDVGPGYAVAEVPFEGNGNHFGVMYAGVLFTVGEVLGGALAMATFDMSSYFPLVRDLRIDFLKPAGSNVRASTSLREGEIERVRADAEHAGKAQFELVAELHDEAGTLVARTFGTYQIRRIA